VERLQRVEDERSETRNEDGVWVSLEPCRGGIEAAHVEQECVGVVLQDELQDVGDRATSVRDKLGNTAGLADDVDDDVLENLMATAEKSQA
jgi:hypothetical protein